MEFHGTKWYFIWRPKSSMEFHGTPVSFEMAPFLFHGITCNLVILYLATPEFRGIPWNSPWKSRVTWYWIKWQSESSMEFHGSKWYFHLVALKFNGIPWNISWNALELSYISFGSTRVLWKSMEFHGTLVSFEMAPSQFRGIPWNSFVFYLATP